MFSHVGDVTNTTLVKLTASGAEPTHIAVTVNNPPENSLFVSKHIFECAKDLSPKFTMTPFYKMASDSSIDRLLKEAYFINLYKPFLNR